MNKDIVAKIMSRVHGRTIQFADAEEAADAVKEAGTAQVDLAKILEALGVPNAANALAALPELMKAKAMLADVQKQLDAATAAQAEVAAAREGYELDRVMATHKLPASARVALKHYRSADPEGFAKTYPLPPEDKEHLLRSLVAGPKGRQIQAPRSLNMPRTLDIEERADEEQSIDVRPYAGRNTVEKLQSYLRETNKAAESWTKDRLLTEAAKLRHTHAIIS